ncbi:MAG: thioesterase family protein [Leptospiraceae bacterium]|nr:thioesterase family protein [Leptospiraceae bacterium]
MSTYKFDKDVFVGKVSDGIFHTKISSDYNIAAPNGGYLMSILGNAAIHSGEFSLPLSMSVYYHRPTKPGEAEIHTKKLFGGPRLETFDIRLFQGKEESITCTASFTRENAFRGLSLPSPPPNLPQFEECTKAVFPQIVFYTPISLYLPEVQLEWINGKLKGERKLTGYLEFADGREIDPLSLLLFSDASFPPVMRYTGGLAWVPTIEISVQIRGIPRGKRIGLISMTRFVSDGLLETDAELYNETGEILALSRQLAVIKEKKRRPISN